MTNDRIFLDSKEIKNKGHVICKKKRKSIRIWMTLRNLFVLSLQLEDDIIVDQDDVGDEVFAMMDKEDVGDVREAIRKGKRGVWQ